ncbi:MAG: DNA-binding protein [Oscillospiraceae bacterium]|nr:DNA-binding protein [Oscillospiraceae bacterium]
MHATELILLYDYYGDLLTDRQRECFELRYNQDLSLGEIGQELGISRQGVHDNLTRTEALLVNMEQKTGCVRRDQRCRKVIDEILRSALELRDSTDVKISAAAQRIITAAEALEE